MNKPVKYHIGCGWRNFGEDWIHVDGGDYDHLDSKDITLATVASDSADLIYASHLIEYFDRQEIEPILTGWKRVLRPEGVLRLAVPDFFKMAELYCNSSYSLEDFLGPLYGRMEMGDRVIYHKTTYDILSLKELLLSQGFCAIKRYRWQNTEHAQFDDHSQAYKPHMEKEKGTLISLNVECRK